MICPKCFNTNDDTANNCVHCGNLLKSSDTINQNGAMQGFQISVDTSGLDNLSPEEKAKRLNEWASDPRPAAEKTEMLSAANVTLTQQQPQQQLSDDPFMNQVLNQQANPQPPKFDAKKVMEKIPVDKIKGLLKNKFVLIGAGVIVVAIVGITLYNIFRTPSAEELMKAHPDYADAFFFGNEDDEYALVSKEGKMLTDFDFKYSYNTFVGGYTLVTNKDGEYGIIGDNGKMSVAYGKYDYLLNVGALYLATEEGNDYSDGSAKYISGNGSVVISDGTDYELKMDASNSYLTTFEYNDNIVVFNYKGKKVTTIGANKDLFMHDEDVYANIYSDGVNHIINAQTGKVIAKFEDKDTYCINGVSEDGKIISVNTCDNSYWNSADEDDDFKLIVDGKVIDTEDECEKVSVQYGNVICVKDDERYLLNSDYERSVSFDEELAYIDGDNYAIYDDGKVSIYKNGEKVKSIKDVDDLYTGRVYYDTYLILHDDDKFTYYDLSGEKVVSVDYEYAYAFDGNERAIVRTDREYYLINKEGKKVSKGYAYINSYDGNYYIVRDEDDNYGIIDKDGKVLVELEYESITPYGVDLKTYFSLYKDDKYSLYDLQEKKITIDNKDSLSLGTYYVECEVDGDYEYFTYNGRMFYEK